MHQNKTGRKKFAKITMIVLFSVLAVWAVALVVIQIVLTPSVLKRIVDGAAAEYVDGNVAFSGIKASVFKNFPYLNVSIDSLSVTYPSDRFADAGAGSDWYTSVGRGEECDTLVSFSRLSASVNLAGLVAGKISVPRVILSKPRIFATIYSDGRASWDLLKFPSDTTAAADTLEEDSGMPEIRLGRIRLVRDPAVVFSSLPDSVRASVIFRRMSFDGMLSRRAVSEGKIRLKVDSLFLTGRLPSDTVALALDKMNIEAGKGTVSATADATTYLATRSYGRLRLPLSLDSEIRFPEDSSKTFMIPHFTAAVAAIPLNLSGELQFEDDGIRVKGKGSIDGCKVNDVLQYFGKNFWKGAKDLKTDASITLSAEFDGLVGSDGRIPAITAMLTVPHSTLRHKDDVDGMELALSASLAGDTTGVMNLDVKELYAASRWLDVNVGLKASDILGTDPLFDVKGNLSLNLDSLSFKPDMLKDYDMHGGISVGLDGKINLSQMSLYRFAEANLNGFVKSDTLKIVSKADSLEIYTDSIDVWLGTVGNTRDKDVAEGERMIAAVAYIDSLYMNSKDAMFLKGKALSLKAQNSAAILNSQDSTAFYPFGGRFESDFIQLRGADTTSISVVKTDNIFKISPKASDNDVPVLTLTSDTDRMFVRGPVNRLAGRNLSVSMTAAMNSIERRKKVKAFRDSLAKAYPDVPRDSLFAHVFGKNFQRRPKPSWLTEDDFRKNDLDFRLDKTLAKYYRDWDLEGKIALDRLRLISPVFPLRNSVSGLNCTFSNNDITLHGLRVSSGKSSVSISGELSELRRALLRNGTIKLDLDMNADKLDFNEMFAALAAGEKFQDLAADNTDFSGIDDSEYEEMVVIEQADTSASVPASSLIVIPANVDASISLNAENVDYSKLSLKTLTSDLVIRDRCIQFTNTSGLSEMGNMFFEGFYATRSKKDIKTGFNLNFYDVTAEKVIEMVPAVDTVMPMLKSFKGHLDCEIAATAELDTSMNIEVPSINGVLRIGGEGLELQNDETIKKLAKILKFKDRQTSRIDRMSVEGMIADSKLEIFPFVLEIDRYTLAMSGVQNLDSSFKYHISVIKSPLPFRLGVDLSGNFDDFKFKIGKAKYKSTNVPVFSAVVDETKLNLAESIHNIFKKGVEAAVRENMQQQAIADFKSRTGYVQAVDEQLDSLSSEEKQEFETQDEVTEEASADSLSQNTQQ